MKTFTQGAKLFCDFPFGGKPKAVCIEVIEAGDGKSALAGRVRVKGIPIWQPGLRAACDAAMETLRRKS